MKKNIRDYNNKLILSIFLINIWATVFARLNRKIRIKKVNLQNSKCVNKRQRLLLLYSNKPSPIFWKPEKRIICILCIEKSQFFYTSQSPVDPSSVVIIYLLVLSSKI